MTLPDMAAFPIGWFNLLSLFRRPCRHSGTFNRHSGLRRNLAFPQRPFAGQTTYAVWINSAANADENGSEGVRFRRKPE